MNHPSHFEKSPYSIKPSLEVVKVELTIQMVAINIYIIAAAKVGLFVDVVTLESSSKSQRNQCTILNEQLKQHIICHLNQVGQWKWTKKSIHLCRNVRVNVWGYPGKAWFWWTSESVLGLWTWLSSTKSKIFH